MESRLEEIFSMGINCMSLAVWLVEDRKCSAAVVGLDLDLGSYGKWEIYGTFLRFLVCYIMFLLVCVIISLNKFQDNIKIIVYLTTPISN